MLWTEWKGCINDDYRIFRKLQVGLLSFILFFFRIELYKKNSILLLYEMIIKKGEISLFLYFPFFFLCKTKEIIIKVVIINFDGSLVIFSFLLTHCIRQIKHCILAATRGTFLGNRYLFCGKLVSNM